jgi:hypothetical protein
VNNIFSQIPHTLKKKADKKLGRAACSHTNIGDTTVFHCITSAFELSIHMNMRTKGKQLPSFKVSTKLCKIKELMCTWITKARANVLPTLVDKM